MYLCLIRHKSLHAVQYFFGQIGLLVETSSFNSILVNRNIWNLFLMSSLAFWRWFSLGRYRFWWRRESWNIGKRVTILIYWKQNVLEEGGGKYRSIYRIDAFLSINIDVSLDWIHLHYFSMYGGGKLYYSVYNVLYSYFTYRYKDMIFKYLINISTKYLFQINQYFLFT